MRSALAWLVGIVLLLFTAANLANRSEAFGQRPLGEVERSFATGEILALSSDVDAAQQQIVVIDAKARVLSVYHVNRASGEVALKSVRNIRGDMQLDDFNGVSPLPREIRAMLEGQQR